MPNIERKLPVPATVLTAVLLVGSAAVGILPALGAPRPVSQVGLSTGLGAPDTTHKDGLSITLGPPTTLRDSPGRSDQPARVIPDTVVTAGGRPSPSGVVTNFVREASTGITRLQVGFATLSGGAFDPDLDLAETTRSEDLGIDRPDAIVDPSTGNALFAYILNIRGRHDILFGQLVEPFSDGVSFTPRWLNRTDIRTPQQIAFARPADLGAPRQIVGFTAFRTDASAGSIVYAASLNPADLSAEIVNVTPVGFRNCADIHIFFSAVGPVATARCRHTESTLWRAVIARLPGVQPWTGEARLTEPTIIGPDDEAEDLRFLDAAMDPEGREITLAWAASAEPSRPELEWVARRFDVAAWSPIGEAEAFGGEGVEAAVRYLDLRAHGWDEMRAILDVAADGATVRGRVTLAGRRSSEGELLRASAWLEPNAVPDGILAFGAWSPPDMAEDVDAATVPVGLVVYRLDGRLTARRLDIAASDPVATPTIADPTADPSDTPDPAFTATPTAVSSITPDVTPTVATPETTPPTPSATPTEEADPSATPLIDTPSPTSTTPTHFNIWLPFLSR